MAEAVPGGQHTSAARDGKSAHGGTVARLVQAILREGAYRPDHVDFKRMRDNLFDRVVGALGPGEEVLIVRPGGPDPSEVMVKVGREGEVPLRLALGGGGEGARWARGTADLMAGKGVFAIHLGQDIPRTGFARFLLALSETREGAEDSPLREGAVIERKVRALNLGRSAIVAEASLPDPTRRLDWRVNLALARMQQSLHEIAPAGRTGRAPKTRTREMASLVAAIETLGSPDSLKQLLLHLDTLDQEAFRLPDVDLLSETVRRFPRETLAPLARSLLDEVERGPEPGGAPPDRVRHLLGAIVPRLLDEPEGTEDLGPLVADLLRWGLVEEEKLPQRLRETLKLARVARNLSDRVDEFLEALDAAPSAQEYTERIDLVVSILPHLAEQGRVDELRQILARIERHRREWDQAFPERSLIASRAGARIARLALAPMLENLFRTGSDRDRERLVEVFQMLQEGAVPTLVEVLKKSEERPVRRAAIAALRGVGGGANRTLAEELRQPDQQWFVVRNLLLVLGEVGTMAETPLMSEFVKHPHPRVREEAMGALTRLGGAIFETYLVEGLRDSDEGVKQRALGCLEAIRSRNPAVFSFLMEILGDREREGGEAPIPLQVAACRYVARVGNVLVDPAAGVWAQDLLLARLRHKAGGGGDGLTARLRKVTSLLRGSRSPWDVGKDQVRAAACEALGAVGEERVLGELAQLGTEASPALQRIAQEACRRIKERRSHETVQEQDPLHRT